MQFLHISSPKEGAEILTKKIEDNLRAGHKVLWLLSGGSNIGISVQALKILQAKNISLKNLTVTLTDERYGLVGHPDSNWQQLINTGFNFDLVKHQPILQNLDFNQTVEKFKQNYQELYDWADMVIGQFGIGTDGHTAGILPKPDKYKRISLDLETIKNIDIACTFVFGEAKREVIQSLKNKNLSLDIMPAQILKEIKDSYLLSDCV